MFHLIRVENEAVGNNRISDFIFLLWIGSGVVMGLNNEIMPENHLNMLSK